MATPDLRLLPLIESIIAAGADWLAFEIVEGLRLGFMPEETEDFLRDIRADVRTATQIELKSIAPRYESDMSEPIDGDVQIEWAIRYVTKRLSDALSMLDVSIGALNEIVSTGVEDGPRLISTAEYSGISVQIDNDETFSSQYSLEEARTALISLDSALRVWRRSVRSSGGFE
ncbi:MAG: hypothetical protein AB1508_11545 [Pseudomonadota bacterium]